MHLDPTHPRATPASEPLEETAPRTESWVGKVIDGRYRLEARLAAGGMGEVYRATHVELGRTLALKVMRPELSGDASFVERFRREAMTASRLGHPHIVDIIDSGRSETGQFYFVMEFLEGQPLSALVPVELPVALELVAQVAEALDVAHRAGVVHRDLKPDNVIVLQRSGKPFVKLVDFGIAKTVTPSADQKQTTHGVIMGTPQYMAPEQAAGVAVDARADVYALGLIAFELLTGRPPLTGETAALVMAAHINQKAPELPGTFPQPLRALVAAMLAKRPGERPASMARVRELLAAVPRTTARAGSTRRWLGVMAVAIAVGAIGALTMLRGRSEKAAPTSRETAPAAPAPSVAAPSVAAPSAAAPSAADPVATAPAAAAPVDPASTPAPRLPAGIDSRGAATPPGRTNAPPPGKSRSPSQRPSPTSPPGAPTGIIKEYPGE